MKLASGQARSVIPPTIPMCRKGPVAWGGKGRVSAGTSPAPVPKIHMLQCQGSAIAASTAGRATVPGREGQAPRGTEQTPCSGPATTHHPDCSCSRQDCKSRRSTLPGQAAEVNPHGTEPCWGLQSPPFSSSRQARYWVQWRSLWYQGDSPAGRHVHFSTPPPTLFPAL